VNASPSAGHGLVVVVPVKRLSRAKSRLDVPAATRRAVALGLAEHTIRVALATPEVVRVLVVTCDTTVKLRVRALGADLVHEPRSSNLNAAARLGREAAGRMNPGDDVAIMVSDLPELSTDDLSAAVGEFRARGELPMMVADTDGTGTTMLIHGAHATPRITFGPGSAQRHQTAGFNPATGDLRGLRRDLDTTPIPDLVTMPRPGRGTAMSQPEREGVALT
jgi:2-phospho-L-lactate guanylyltransferase